MWWDGRVHFASDRDGVMILDARDGRVLECNPVAADLLGHPAVEVRGCLARQWLARPEYADRLLSDPGRIGPDGPTIGTLADELGLSKSGLFAHFRSKEALVIQLLERASESVIESTRRAARSSSAGLASSPVPFQPGMKVSQTAASAARRLSLRTGTREGYAAERDNDRVGE